MLHSHRRVILFRGCRTGRIIAWGFLPEFAMIAASSNKVRFTVMDSPIYKVIFLNQNQVYEIYCRQIFQSELYGFIEIEELLFGEKSKMIVDPGEEKLKNEFAGVSRSFIPMPAVIRIDEVERQGVAKVRESSGTSNISHFPMGGFRPTNRED